VNDPLLARALDHLGDRYGVEQRFATRIVDLGREKWIERENERRARSLPPPTPQPMRG
jgi:hypothetical protein